MKKRKFSSDFKAKVVLYSSPKTAALKSVKINKLEI